MSAGAEQIRNPIGVMQGRLSPPEGGRFQSFPREGWRAEFAKAREVGFRYIEWIHDEYGMGANPIFSEEGLAELDALKEETGVGIAALCADLFMERPLIRCTEQEQREREAELKALVPVARRIGAGRIVLPLVDHARMETEAEQACIAAVLGRLVPVLEENGVELHVEADLGPREFAAFLRMVPYGAVKVNWDSGNSSGLGYVATEEFQWYGERVGSVHIKDRYRKPKGGIETRPIGEGSADFEDVFRALQSVGYAGGLTLQVARGEAGDEVRFLRGEFAKVMSMLETGAWV